MFTFLPSIAPSSMSKCPENLKKYYSNDICLMFLTLREMSLYVLLIDESKLNVISYEKFEIGERMRHFGKKKINFMKKIMFFSFQLMVLVFLVQHLIILDDIKD